MNIAEAGAKFRTAAVPAQTGFTLLFYPKAIDGIACQRAAMAISCP